MFKNVINFLYNFNLRVGGRLFNASNLGLLYHNVQYPFPIGINYLFGFGFLSGIFLMIQIFSGMLLTVYYVPTTEEAFDSVDFIRRRVAYGWFFQSMHQVGASFYFFCLYVHFARSFWFKSYRWPNAYVWWSGLIIFILSMAIAFLGYVLPWSQTSFWAATVITNFLTAIPLIGGKIVLWGLWGGWVLYSGSLKRFAILHYTLPFILLGLICLHLLFLHVKGSNDSVTCDSFSDHQPFVDLAFEKDLLLASLFLSFYCYIFHTCPRIFTDHYMYQKADPLVGIYVLPEWYFLPFFGILKGVRSKELGIFFLFFFFFLLALAPYSSTFCCTYVMNNKIDFLYMFFSTSTFCFFTILGNLARLPVTEGIFHMLNFLVYGFFINLIINIFIINYFDNKL